MPGTSTTYYDYLDTKPNINDLFSFFYVRVSVSYNKYIGLLPYRVDDNTLTMILGTWEGWCFKQLKLAQDNGYNIKIIKG